MSKGKCLGLVFGVLAALSVHGAELAPDWELTNVEGRPIQLSAEVREQPVIILFWATWCPYCKALMPHLQSIRLEHGDAVKVLAVSFREKGDPIGYVESNNYDSTVLPNGDDVAKQYEVWGTPGVIIVDGERQIAFDLRDLPPYQRPAKEEKSSHQENAAYRAPYWAAEIRKSLDEVLGNEVPGNSRE